MDSESQPDFTAGALPFVPSTIYGADRSTYNNLYYQDYDPYIDPAPQNFAPNMIPGFDAGQLPATRNEDVFDPSLQLNSPLLEVMERRDVDGDKRGKGRPRKQFATHEAEEVLLAQTDATNHAEATAEVEKSDTETQEASKKLGRGRTPKAKLSAGIEWASDSRIANADVEDPVAEPSLKKRGRGRPPKVPAVAAEIEESDQKETPDRKRTRAQVAEDTRGQDKEAEADEPTKKRGRGRPRKSLPNLNEIVETVGSEVVQLPIDRRSRRSVNSDMSSDDGAKQPSEDDQEQVEVPPKKRGPGRPRKSAIATPATPVLKATAITPETVTKRRPGRPPKKRRGGKPRTPGHRNVQHLESDKEQATVLDHNGGHDGVNRTIIALPTDQGLDDFIRANPTLRNTGLVTLGQVHDDGIKNIRRVIEDLNRNRGDTI